MKKILIVLLILVITGCFNNENDVNDDVFTRDKVIIYFFWDRGCGFCNQQKPYMEEFAEQYEMVELKAIEAWRNQETIDIFQALAQRYNTSAGGVPVTFIGDKSWLGFQESMLGEMEEQILLCLEDGCEDWAYEIVFE